MAEEKLNEKFFDMSVSLAEHNLEVALKKVRDDFFRVAKQVAREAATGEATMETLKQMDDLVRIVYSDDQRRTTEWEEIMRGFEFSEDVIDDGK